MTVPIKKLNPYNIAEVYTGVQLPIDHHAVCWENSRFVTNAKKDGKKFINLLKPDDKLLMSIPVPKDKKVRIKSNFVNRLELEHIID